MKGGSRTGSGRKSKAEEMGLPKLIEEVIGDTGKRELIRQIYAKAKENSFKHQELLMHYIFGKPQDKMDLTTGGQAFDFKEIVFRDYASKP